MTGRARDVDAQMVGGKRVILRVERTDGRDHLSNILYYHKGI